MYVRIVYVRIVYVRIVYVRIVYGSNVKAAINEESLGIALLTSGVHTSADPILNFMY